MADNIGPNELLIRRKVTSLSEVLSASTCPRDDEIEAILPKANGSTNSVRAKLGVVALACITFLSVSAGPFGTEDAMQATGALPVLIGLPVLGLLWALPQSMVTTELATAFPEDSGCVAWCSVAFGSFWGWIQGWLVLISIIIDNAASTVIIVDYCALAFPALGSGYPRMWFLLIATFFLVLPGYLGLELMGWMQVVITVLVLSPFLVLLFVVRKDFDISNWNSVAKDLDWETWINIMFWNFTGWSVCATLAGEVDQPGRTFPRAMLMAVVLVMVAYFVPIGTVAGVVTNFKDSAVGMYGEVAALYGGQWLMNWVVVAAVASGVGCLEAELNSAAYMMVGMAERGLFPKIFTVRSKTFDTPILPIWCQWPPLFLLTSFGFRAIVGMSNIVFALSMILVYLAMLRLRVAFPDVPRPFRMPGDCVVIAVALVPSFAILAWLIVIPLYKQQVVVLAGSLTAVVCGCLMYPLMQSKWFRLWVATEPLNCTTNVSEYFPLAPE